MNIRFTTTCSPSLKLPFVICLVVGCILVLLGCDSESIEYDERLRIYVNSQLAEEFIYSDNGELKRETTYFSTAFTKWVHCSESDRYINEKYEYVYHPDGQVDYIEIYDIEGTYVGRDTYLYNNQNKFVGVTYFLAPQNAHRKVRHFDYAILGIFSCPEFPPRQSDCTWTDDFTSSFSYKVNGSENISDLWSGYYNFDFEYDTKANPLYKFKGSRSLPARMSPNNVTKVSMLQSADVGGPPSTSYSAEINIAYEYNNEGLPISAIRTFSCQQTSETIVYKYDRVPSTI